MCNWGTNKLIKLSYPMHNSKRIKINVDSCLAPLVQMLNDYNIHTIGCCCGHNKVEGEITILQDGKTISIKIPKNK